MATTAWKNPDGSQAWASPGAVNQHGGNLPIRRCGDCGEPVVWATSRKTGRKYLVNVRFGRVGQRFYMGHDFHRCEPRADGGFEWDPVIRARNAEALTAAAWESVGGQWGPEPTADSLLWD